MDEIQRLINTIAEVGKNHSSYPNIHEIDPFYSFYGSNKRLDYSNIDKRDGSCTRRELLLRFLLLCSVIDQGPDLIGVRKLVVEVTNSLYQKEVRFLHTPIEFFKELGIAIEDILRIHKSIKDIRSEIWGRYNQANPKKYNLFIDNSKQVLNYAVFRWGVPLALPLLLEKDCKDEDKKATVFTDFLAQFSSAEEMSVQIKENERYGLGKAIGDKACHLFAKWVVSSFNLSIRKDSGWGNFSFEVPYDSNAGRILWRTGYLLKWTSINDYKKRNVIQPGQGKGGTTYIRVTNIRGMNATKNINENIYNRYSDIAINHLKTHKRPPKKIEIQRIQHAYLLHNYDKNGFTVADFDEGLIYVGTRFCQNHSDPLCKECPIKDNCEGYKLNRKLITNYRT